jgi:hypothetical protein
MGVTLSLQERDLPETFSDLEKHGLPHFYMQMFAYGHILTS